MNTIDKVFIFSFFISLIGLISFPLLIALALNSPVMELLGAIIFVYGLVCWWIIIPVNFLIQLITLVCKVIKKKKSKKDYWLICLNFASIIVFGFFILIVAIITISSEKFP